MRKIITSVFALALAAVLAPATAAADGPVCPPGYEHHEFNGIDNCTAPGSVNGQYPWEAWADYGQPQGDPQPGGEVEQPQGDPQPQQQPQGDPLGTSEVEQPQPGSSQPQPQQQPQEQPAIVEVPEPVEVVPEQREPQAQTAGGGCRAAVIFHYKNVQHVGYWETTGCINDMSDQVEPLIDQMAVDALTDYNGPLDGWKDVRWYDLNHLGELPAPTCTTSWERTGHGPRGGTLCEFG